MIVASRIWCVAAALAADRVVRIAGSLETEAGMLSCGEASGPALAVLRIEVFRAFLAAGQSEVDSYRSAARIFRGGDVRGRVCFTKDGAYLEGVMLIHVFIRKALQEGRGELLPMLFAGRLTTADVVTLAPFRESGLVAPPRYLPPWARDPQRVLSIMAFSAAAQRLQLDRLDLQRFVDYEDEVIAEADVDG